MKTLLFVFMSVLSMTLQANPLFDQEEEQHIPRENVNLQPSRVDAEGLPEYPHDSNLRQLNIRHSDLIYYVDLASILPTKKNNVRLVTVAISASGARTAVYEELDCGYRRYKSYGYAGKEGPFRPFKIQEWKPVIDTGNGRYRRTLLDNYLCGKFADAASREKILSRMQSLKPYQPHANQD